MREIKFRAWDKRKKIMEYKDILRGITCFYPYQDINARIAYANSADYILMQYIGLKDKNGKEIWEGDVVKSSLCTGEVFFHKYSWDVKQMPDYLTDDNSVFFDYSGSKDAEVIGNIYQNPELLK